MKDIKNYEGLYAVTSCGKVWSYKSKKFLKLRERKDGYLCVDLCKDGIKKTCFIHRLVAEAYIPNPENKPQINHIDEDKSHNWINNLEWATAKENVNHGTRNERARKANGKPVYCVELDKVFSNAREAGKEIGRTSSAVCYCLHGNTKTCGGYHWRYAS